MLLSAVSVLVVAQSSSEIPEGLTNNPVLLVMSRSEFWGLQTRIKILLEEKMLLFSSSCNLFHVRFAVRSLRSALLIACNSAIKGGGGWKVFTNSLHNITKYTILFNFGCIYFAEIVLYEGAIPARWDYIVVVIVIMFISIIIIIIPSSFKRHAVLRRVRNISKSDYLHHHVCPHVLPQGKSRLPPEGFHEIWYLLVYWKSVRKLKFYENLTRIAGTLHEDQYVFFIISRLFLLRMRNVSNEGCRVNRNENLVPIFFS